MDARKEGVGAVMKSLSIIIIFIFVFISPLYAQEHPTTGLIYNTKEVSSIVHFCYKRENNILHCRFTQTSVRKKADLLSYEELKAKAEESFENAKKDVSGDKSCGGIVLFSKVLQGEYTPEEAAEQAFESGAIVDKAAFISGMKDISEPKKKNMLKTMKEYADFCQNPSLDNHIKFLRAANEMEHNTCRVGPNTYEENFKYVADSVSGAGVWVVISEPTGPCGIINLSRFEKDVTQLRGIEVKNWNYIVKKTITNPKGSGLLGSCKEFDEEEYPYVWRSKEHHLGCDIIEFSPF